MHSNEYAPQLGVWYGSAQAVFIQDGAPSHTSKRTGVCERLVEEHRCSAYGSAAVSPDLNVLDWSTWSQIQDRMAEKDDSVLAVKVNVMRATEELRAQMDMDGIRRVFVRRLFVCIAVRGGILSTTDALSWLIVQRKP